MSSEIPSRSNADWIVLIRRADPDACNDVLRMCKLACARRLTGWPEADPEDAAQDAAIKVILTVRKPDFAIRSLFTSFVLKVATNCACDIQRRIRRERGLLASPGTLDEVAAPEFDSMPANHVARNTLLDSCLGRLNTQEQEIMHWYAAGWGPAWIAQELGPPANRNMIGVRIHRLCARLARCIGSGVGIVMIDP